MLFTPQLIISTIAVFTVSACFGSFFKLVVDRYDTNESIISKKSHCNNCLKELIWWQNIPVLSYLFLKGKCHYCKSKIDISCFFTELFTALIPTVIFLMLSYKGIEPHKQLMLFPLILILILLSIFDLRHRIIPHPITYSTIALGILCCFIFREKNLYIIFANLGIAFAFMDFLYFISGIIKKYEMELSNFHLLLLLWSVFYFFTNEIIIVLFLISLYSLLSKFDLSENILKKIASFSFLILIIQILRLSVFTFDIQNLIVYLSGIGIIYFFCEIVYYPLHLICFVRHTPEAPPSNEIAIGGGDITVFALICVILGYNLGFLTLFLASLLAIISHLIIKAVQNSQASEKGIPFVPFLTVSCFIIIIGFYVF